MGANQEKLKQKVISICNGANLEHYQSPTNDARTRLWNHLWTKIRYAGFDSGQANLEINQLSDLFDDVAWFSDKGWDMVARGHNLIHAGCFAKAFFDRTGQFANMNNVRNVNKLNKTVAIAREFSRFFQENPNSNALDFVTRGVSPDNVWEAHKKLQNIGYTADLTALHFMMDIGFQVIKPDVVVSRLLLDWGWLHKANNELPSDLSRADLLGSERYRSKYQYTKPVIYKPIIELSREIVSDIDVNELEEDIGWVSDNPIREFDIFVVKSGQRPDPEFGIERCLFD